MAKLTEVRLTLAAFIYALEIDLKSILNLYISSNSNDLTFLGDKDFIDKIKQRFTKEYPSSDPNKNIIQVVDFLDFQDTYTIILRNKLLIPEDIVNEIASIVPRLDLIVPIRNRVMHTRPLQVGDFTEVYGFINELTETSNIKWPTTFETRSNIEADPSYVLTLSIPFFKYNTDEIEHNLPLPDFDDTGFIGRKKDVIDIKKLILGNNRVVSIIGDGGIGKTALALKVAYDIIDLKDRNPFDLVIWISAKTTMLTSKGIEEIENALKDYGGVIEGISDFMQIDDKITNKKLVEILEYLEVFDVLLIIDNLETILNEEIREFIRHAQMRCKIMITSRIGLGELEFRRNLSGLSESEAIILIRQFGNIKQAQLLNKLPNNKLIDIATKLHFNPLALKWFVSTVESGVSPDEVLIKKDNLLNFCLSNVYGKLSENAIKVISVILAARKSLNEAELFFLSNISSIELRKSLNELFATTFIAREIENLGRSQEVKYNIPDFAKEYVLRYHPIKSQFIQHINQLLKSLSKKTEEIIRVSGYNEFGINALSIRTPTEKVTARLLAEALKLSKMGRPEAALSKISEAKSIFPNYFEIYRVSAFIKATFNDYLGAEQDYKLGLEIEQDNPRLLYFYAGFLYYQLNDTSSAFEFAQKLINLRPNSPNPTFLFARILAAVDRIEEAIDLIRNLLNRGDLTDVDIRKGVTDLISFYGDWGVQIVQKEGDFELAKNRFSKALELFKRSVKEKNYDEKLIKSVCITIILFIKNIPRSQNEQNLSFLRKFVEQYNDIIALNENRDYILNLLKQNYSSEANDLPKYKGRLDNFDPHKPYVFIIADDGNRYYSNYRMFRPNVWNSLEPDDFVAFDIGSNQSGECAINVIKLKNDGMDLE
jgi:LuxR family transcriptional regulator, glucitol operon activator